MTKPVFGVPMMIGAAAVPALIIVIPVNPPLPSSAPVASVELLMTPFNVMLLERMKPGSCAAVTIPGMLGNVVWLEAVRFHLVGMAISPGDKYGIRVRGRVSQIDDTAVARPDSFRLLPYGHGRDLHAP
jgi:hypothetical protein